MILYKTSRRINLYDNYGKSSEAFEISFDKCEWKNARIRQSGYFFFLSVSVKPAVCSAKRNKRHCMKTGWTLFCSSTVLEESSVIFKKINSTTTNKSFILMLQKLMQWNKKSMNLTMMKLIEANCYKWKITVWASDQLIFLFENNFYINKQRYLLFDAAKANCKVIWKFNTSILITPKIIEPNCCNGKISEDRTSWYFTVFSLGEKTGKKNERNKNVPAVNVIFLWLPASWFLCINHCSIVLIWFTRRVHYFKNLFLVLLF